jgi:predicted nucleotidyltransferase
MDYQKKYLAIARDIVLKHVNREHYAVFLFGSRAAGTHGRSADIDVGIEGDAPLAPKIIAAINEELEQSLVPYHIDIVDFYGADTHFKQIAKQRIITWNRPTNLH